MDSILVGAGRVGIKSAKAQRLHPGFNLKAICDPNESNRQRIGEQTSVDTFRNLSRALEEVYPDIVHIATPPRTHHALALKALSSGADTYIEKVMAMTADEARDILSTAEAYDCNVFVRRNALYTPVFRHALRKREQLGTVRRVAYTTPVNTYDDLPQHKVSWLRKLPGGIISEHLPHAIYVVRRFMGLEPEQVTAKYDGDTLLVTLDCNICQGAITFVPDQTTPHRVEVVGTDGSFVVNEDLRYLASLRKSNIGHEYVRILWDNLKEIIEISKHTIGLVKNHLRKRALNAAGFRTGHLGRNTHYRQLDDIYRGKTDKIDGEEGLRNVTVFEKIWNDASVDITTPQDGQARGDAFHSP